jgi:HEXXH motif-containing protein
MAPQNDSAQPPQLAVHKLTPEHFAVLARGGGGRAEVAELAASQRSKRLVQVCRVVKWARAWGGEVAAEAEHSFELLCAAEAVRPDAVRAVLAHPYLDNWASICIGQLGWDDRDADGRRPPVATGYLTTVAVAAAARAGLSFELSLASAGDVVIPTLGTVLDLGDGVVKVVGEPHRLTFQGSTATVVVARPFEAPTHGWAPVRIMRMDGDRGAFALAIEDQDPYRDCYQWRPAERLVPTAGNHLEALCRQAWALIAEDHPEHADGMRTALVSLMPLAPSGDGMSQGATSFRAFGSLAISTGSDPASLALALIHEFQHMKLVAIIDLFDLHKPGGQPRHFAPWRADPRPVLALLHGAYAHVGVCDFWRRRRTRLTAPAAARAAHFEFALWRRLTLQAVESLLDSDELTELGVAFVEPLRDRLTQWGTEPVPPEVDRAAADAALAYAVRWRLINATPPPRIDRLAAAPRPAWLPARLDPVALLSEHGPSAGTPNTAEPVLATRIRAKVTAQPVPAMSAKPDPVAGRLRDADSAYLAGEFDLALRGYATAIEHGEAEGWVGLAVVFSRNRVGSTAVAENPYLAWRLHAAGRGRAGPIEVAAWLATNL